MIALVLALAVTGEWRIDDPAWRAVYQKRTVSRSTRARCLIAAFVRSKAERIVDVACGASVGRDNGHKDHYAEFMPFVNEAQVLDRQPSSQLFYQRLTPPVVSDRDVVLAISVERDERMGIFKATWTSVGDRGPAPIRGVVRLTDVRGQWMVERLTETASRLTYFAFIEPGGAIPRWMANRANNHGAPDAVLAIVHRAAATPP